MTEYTYYVICEKNQDNKYFSHAEKVHNNINLLHEFHACNGFELVSINACKTLKLAKEIADCWNASYKSCSRYAF